jgi:hypothetical protein
MRNSAVGICLIVSWQLAALALAGASSAHVSVAPKAVASAAAPVQTSNPKPVYVIAQVVGFENNRPFGVRLVNATKELLATKFLHDRARVKTTTWEYNHRSVCEEVPRDTPCDVMLVIQETKDLYHLEVHCKENGDNPFCREHELKSFRLPTAEPEKTLTSKIARAINAHEGSVHP